MSYSEAFVRRLRPGTRVRTPAGTPPLYLPARLGNEDCFIKLSFEATVHRPEKPRPADHAPTEEVHCFGCDKRTWLIELGRLRRVDGRYRFERDDYCPQCRPYELVELVFTPGRDTDRVKFVGWLDEDGRPISEFDEEIDRWLPLGDSFGLRWTHKDVRDHKDRFDQQTRRVVSLRTPKTPRA